MSGADVAVLVLSVLAIVGLGWFFFGPRRGRTATLADGVQRVSVTVKGGYRPDLIHVRQGVPVEIEFDRQDSGECTNRVVFTDFGVNAGLPASRRSRTLQSTRGIHGARGIRCERRYGPGGR